jgi:hypothetical protein
MAGIRLVPPRAVSRTASRHAVTRAPSRSASRHAVTRAPSRSALTCASLDFCDRPPRWPRVASDRMNTRGSVACRSSARGGLEKDVEFRRRCRCPRAHDARPGLPAGRPASSDRREACSASVLQFAQELNPARASVALQRRRGDRRSPQFCRGSAVMARPDGRVKLAGPLRSPASRWRVSARGLPGRAADDAESPPMAWAAGGVL